MDNVLIVSSNEHSVSVISQLLKPENCIDTDTASSAEEGRSCLSLKEYDLIIINSPLIDDSRDTFAEEAAGLTDAGIILLVKSAAEAGTESRLSPFGVFVLGKPVSAVLFHKAIRLLEASANRLKGIQHENDRLQKQIEDTRIINRAKAVLIQYLSMTEPQAHKYLEKQAMDLRISKAEAARRLLSTYEY